MAYVIKWRRESDWKYYTGVDQDWWAAERCQAKRFATANEAHAEATAEPHPLRPIDYKVVKLKPKPATGEEYRFVCNLYEGDWCGRKAHWISHREPGVYPNDGEVFAVYRKVPK